MSPGRRARLPGQRGEAAPLTAPSASLPGLVLNRDRRIALVSAAFPPFPLWRPLRGEMPQHSVYPGSHWYKYHSVASSQLMPGSHHTQHSHLSMYPPSPGATPAPSTEPRAVCGVSGCGLGLAHSLRSVLWVTVLYLCQGVFLYGWECPLHGHSSTREGTGLLVGRTGLPQSGEQEVLAGPGRAGQGVQAVASVCS